MGPEFPSNATDGPLGNNANQLPRDANNLGIEDRDDLPLLQSEADIQMALTLQRRELAHRRLLQQAQLVKQCLSTGNVDMVDRETSKLDALFDELTGVHICFTELEDDKGKLEAAQWLAEVDEVIFKVKSAVCDWMIKAEKESHSSRSSKRSSSTSRTRRSNARMTGLDFARHGETGDAHAKKTLTKDDTTERSLLLNDRQRSTPVSNFNKYRVKDEIELEDNQGFKQGAVAYEYKRTGMQPLKAVERSPSQAVRERQLEDIVRLQLAPVADLDVFDGNPLNFHYFRANFRDVVEDNVADQRGRLTRLLKYTSGDAKELIKGCIHEHSSHCFDKAIALLEKEFGDEQLITTSYMNELRRWPLIKQNDAKGIRALHRFLLQCESLKRGGRLHYLDSVECIRLIVAKFGTSIQEQWNKRSLHIYQRSGVSSSFSHLIEFVSEQLKLASNSEYSRDAFSEIKERRSFQPFGHSNLKAFVSSVDGNSGGTETKCTFCSADHTIDKCPSFGDVSIDDRIEFVKQQHLCFCCLKRTNKGHYAAICQKKLKCEKCNEDHPTVLHEQYAESLSVNTVSHISSGQTFVSICIVPVVLYHKDAPQQKVKVYAMLDECSQGTFISEEVLAMLPSVNSSSARISIQSLCGASSESCKVVQGLAVQGVLERPDCLRETVHLPKVYSRTNLPVNSNDVARPSAVRLWSHLKRVADEMPEFDSSIPVGLLIGANCPRALEPCEVQQGFNGGPYAYRSRLGWCIVGPLEGVTRQTVKCNLIALERDCPKPAFNAEESFKDITIDTMLKQMYMVEFAENQREENGMSPEDRRFLKLMNENVTIADGHYVVPLPFKDKNVKLPDNRQQAIQRCLSLKKRLKKDSQFHQDYALFMDNLFEKGYAQEVSNTDQGEDSWFLPHHGVYHPTKKKIRVVFDCAASHRGQSLNGNLISGPDETSSLLGVLLRFRQGLVPFTADIESMYYQVRVPESQRKYLKFLWWPGGDLDQPLKEFQMCVHVFGATSSPACANFALRRTADDNPSYSSEARDTLKQNFYVDDCLKSISAKSSAKKLVTEIDALCTEGGFNLTQYLSNEADILEPIARSKWSDTIKGAEICGDERIERTLGVIWHLHNDSLGFRIELNDTPLTRRGILSSIGSIFDPLGIASPFMIKGKLVLQSIVCDGYGWDDPISDCQKEAWCKWRVTLQHLNNISVPRSFQKSHGQPKHTSLHSFSDASEMAYGQVTYLRQVFENDTVEVDIVMAKSRVTPKKAITIPRLELTAAVTSAKVTELIREELNLEHVPSVFWCDSQVALGYIRNETRRFKIFVANRVQMITNRSEANDWHHVETTLNPADLCSRGARLEDESSLDFWFHGPVFLKDSTFEPMKEGHTECLSDDDPEVRVTKGVFSCKLTDDNWVLDHLVSRVSSWQRLISIVAWVLRWQQARKIKGELQSEERNKAELVLLRMVQRQTFPEMLDVMQSGDSKMAKLPKYVQKLVPFLDEDGLIRVSGRLVHENAGLACHAILLHKKNVAAKLIAEFYHKQVMHMGRTTTVGAIRCAGYWVIGITPLVKSLVFNCVRCRFLRGREAEQLMASLPAERLSTEGPFVNTGLDLFGPFTVKDGRKHVKRYVTLFTCMASRAVHLEVTKDLSTDAFINALRRFMARRGYVRKIQSDNGTNFLGADNEMKALFKEMDHQKISKFAIANGFDWVTWKRNVPCASHMGGVWERQIRTVRSVFRSLLKDVAGRLDEDMLRTFMCEAENVVNSRPLCSESVSDPTSDVLTPNHLLTMKSRVVLAPPGVFQMDDQYCRKRWRIVQHLVNVFWKQWKRSYLVSLQERKRWQQTRRNFRENDVVMVKDEDTPRNVWPLARVKEVIPSEDGLVRKVVLVVPSAKHELVRPVHKLVLLVEAEKNSHFRHDSDKSGALVGECDD